MSWKPPRRTLQNVPKVKLMYGHPLPESVDDATPVNDFEDTGEKLSPYQRNGSFAFSSFNSSFPVATQTLEDSYLDRFDKLSEFDQGDDSDLEQLFSEFGGTDGSSLDNSSASFLSWADEVDGQGATKTKELFEELEMALYGEDPALVKDEELSSECVAWKSSHIYLRVIGKKPYIQETLERYPDLENECSGDVEEEIIASHGCIEESTNTEIAAESGDAIASSSGISSDNLIEKVKASVLEQLAFSALSEALKSFEYDLRIGKTEVKQSSMSPPVDGAVSALANLSEDLGRALQISGRSIHRSPKTSSELGRKTLFSINPEQIQSGVQPKRFLSNINVIPEDKMYITPDNSFSVLGVPKPLNAEFLNTKTKMLEKRGFHSAADRKRPGILDRRFSCISPEHDKLLKPSRENEESEPNPLVTVDSKQFSAPNTPLKLLRHLTLPPIQNLNSYNKLSVNSEEKSQSSLTHIRRIFVKNKVSLSPLPNAVNISTGGVTDLQLAKKLLDSTPDSGRWSSCRKLGFTSFQNVKSRKKNIDKIFDNS